MALRIISIAQSSDPLAYEREDHRARALEVILSNPLGIIEKDEIGLTKILDSGTLLLKVPALPEPRLLFVDPAGDDQGENDNWKTGSEAQAKGGSGLGKEAGEQEEELSQSPSNRRASRFGESGSGVGQSKSVRRGEELGHVLVSEDGRETEGMGTAHLPEDESDPEFSFGNEYGMQAGVDLEEIAFEESIHIDHLLDMMAEQFHLPILRTTSVGLLRVRTKGRPYGVRMKGPQSQLSKRKTSEKRIERIGEGDDGFVEEDLRYIRHESREEYKSNAVVVLVRDASGSTRKEEILNLIRAFCLHTLRAIRVEHDLVDLVFVTFDSEAKRHEGEKAEWEFFHRYAHGGTLISSGLNMARDILEKEYSGIEWNKFIFVLSDGEKQGEEIISPALLSEAIARLAPIADILGYFEVGRVGLAYPDYDPVTGVATSSLVYIDSDGTIRDPIRKTSTGSFTAIKEFLDATYHGQDNIVAVRFGDNEGAGKAFSALIDFCEKRREGHE